MFRLFTALLGLSLFQPAIAASDPAATTAARKGVSKYVSPEPGARYVLAQTNLIVRPGGIVDALSIADGTLITAKGSKSGEHAGTLAVSDDQRTITFTPDVPFEAGESVSWRIEAGLASETRSRLPAQRLDFTIAEPNRAALLATASSALDLEPDGAMGGVTLHHAARAAPSDRAGAAADSLPEDFPTLTRTVTGSPSPGRLFLCSIILPDPTYRSTLIIADDDGMPIFHRKLPARGLDFKPQPNGRLTYFDTASGCYYAMNAAYAIVDSFRCGNGYSTDLHELQILPNGHAILMSYDPQLVDMSLVVPGGNPTATVVGLIIQELDLAKRVVFQWRSWDHFQITDATHLNMTAPVIDYVHGNAVELDDDGNLLVSNRHMDEITKISRETGEILWRLGGKNNQFQFVNDPVGFSYQHDIRRLPNGDVTLFDNGFFHDPAASRAVEYRLDEQARTATLVWQFVPDPPIVAFATGSVQRLPSGNTLIGWGSANPTLTEVTPAGARITELTFPPGITSYRAFRYEWPPVRSAIVELYPGVLNPRSGGPWVSAVIDGSDFDPKDILVESVRLAGSLPTDLKSSTIEPALRGGRSALRVRFDRATLVPLLRPGVNRVEVSGALRTGELFRGSTDIRLAGSGRPPVGGRTLRLSSAAGAVPVRVSLGGASPLEHAIRVYDVRGRIVADFRGLPDPEGSWTWNGRGTAGAPVGSGIYFVRVSGADRDDALKIVIAR